MRPNFDWFFRAGTYSVWCGLGGIQFVSRQEPEFLVLRRTQMLGTLRRMRMVLFKPLLVIVIAAVPNTSFRV